MRFGLLGILMVLGLGVAHAQVRMKSCIGCVGGSFKKGNYYHQHATGQVFHSIEEKDNYRSGFVFVDASRAGNMKPNYSVYPNPSLEEVNITGNLKSCKIELLDMAGRVLNYRTTNTDMESYSFSLSEQSKGTYFILIHHPQYGVQTFKIVKL